MLCPKNRNARVFISEKSALVSRLICVSDMQQYIAEKI